MMKILFVATSSDRKGKVAEPTGVWYEELAAPYNYFTNLGYEVVFSSVKGGEIPIDPASLQDGYRTEDVDIFLKNDSAVLQLKSSRRADTMSVADFDAVFVPGGLGVMYDMPENESIGKLLSEAWSQGKVVGAVCHGPAAFLTARQGNGELLIKDKRVTGFTNDEEEDTGNTQNVDYLLEDKMKELGANYERGPKWTSYALEDERIITGQNPQSSRKVAELISGALQKK